MVGEQAPMARASFTKREYNDLFDSRGVVMNYKKAFPVLVFAAKLGHPHAQNLLGYCYDRGLVTRRNAKAAALGTSMQRKRTTSKRFTTLLFVTTMEAELRRMQRELFLCIARLR